MFGACVTLLAAVLLTGQALGSASAAVGPASLGFGETVEGAILTPGEIDAYSFSASAGDKVLVRMSRLSGNLVLQVRLYDPGGTKLCEAYNSLPAEIATCTLPSSGTYSILASDLIGSNTGNYSLYLQRLNNPGGAAPIAFGQTLSESISPTAQMDTYTFSANAGDKVLVRMSRLSGDLVLQVRLYGPGGTKLCEAYNALPAEIAACTLPSSGAYSILATDLLGTRTGDYSLYLQRLNNPGGAIPIAFCQTLTESISPTAQMDTYTFSANAGDKVLVRMSRLSGDLVLQVRLYDPGGTKLCEAYNSLPAEIASCTLPSTGAYSILASDLLGARSGNYSLYLQRLNGPCSTETPTGTATQTPTATATRTWTPTSTPTLTRTSTPTLTRTPSGTSTGTSTPTRTRTLTPTPTRTLTGTPPWTPTGSATPTKTSTATSTPTATLTASGPTATDAPSVTPTGTSTQDPALRIYLPLVLRSSPASEDR